MKLKRQLIISVLCFLFGFGQLGIGKEEEIVETWAAKLGDELWDLGLSVTKTSEIKASYKKLNARVLPTDGEGILNTIVSNVNRLLKRKMDSVMCVIEAAERLAEESEENNSTYIYYNSKFSPVYGNNTEIEEIEGVNISYYREMNLDNDNHFYDLKVNLNHSAVHVPTDVYDQGDEIRNSLRWSEGLDNVFISNFLSDPTMSWQYFGSSTGFLRHYPALHWSMGIDVFDCRTRFWYIEAATCSKDVVILVDNSGSMHGMRNTMAKLTVKTILETLSNNDFVNILSFNTTIKAIVPCFPDDMLVQATPENIKVFKNAVDELAPDDKADFPKAFEFAFKLLAKNRENKTCPEGICNQALMLVTDSIPDNFTEVFEKYNWFDNHTHIPVRVFPYLIGREVMNIREIKYMACMNRGCMVHIKDLEEVRSQVLKYISIIARPMVLQAEEHPLTWTHTFNDATGQLDDESEEEDSDSAPMRDYRFMTSVSGPAYDTRANKYNNSINADLLGVAGTDVLVSDIKSLTVPYKIGANGYAFLITNNGYLIFHPDLRPVHKGVKKRNYNSVDLTEVELLDDQILEPRDPSPEILDLREAMVTNAEGTKLGLKIKFHYDDMRRVGVETRNYYFAALNNTPFTMGLVLPHSYGNHWIKAGDEIMKSQQMGIPITNHFKGNWRIHPDWVYCDYQRTAGRSFNTSEDKLYHFLNKISSPGWTWKEKLQTEEFHYETEENKSYNCNRPIVEKDEYFCDKELMQLLVFDAKITEVSYKSSKWAAKNRIEKELVERYGASLRFVATQSGLTRWQNIPDPQDDNENSFGDTNKRALDEVWYRSAVLHHHLDPEAFVFSVPFDAGVLENITVTASHAIFPRDGGNEAPGSVVGFHIQHSALYNRFMEITAKPNCRECQSCQSDELDCYVIDGNGYIVLSEIRNDTGRFFGDVEGAVMEAMISKNIFRHVAMFDYQAVCYYETLISSGVDILWTPFKLMFYLFKWVIGNLIWTLLDSHFFSSVKAEFDDDYFLLGSADISFTSEEITKEVVYGIKEDNKPKIRRVPCDQMGFLYLLQHLNKEGYHSAVPINCSRPFYVKRIQHTNLLLIVVNALHQSCYRKVSARMEKIEYNLTEEMLGCQKLNLNSLPRRRLSGCFNTHPLEQEIEDCTSKGSVHSSTIYGLALALFLLRNQLHNINRIV